MAVDSLDFTDETTHFKLSSNVIAIRVRAAPQHHRFNSCQTQGSGTDGMIRRCHSSLAASWFVVGGSCSLPRSTPRSQPPMRQFSGSNSLG